MRLSLGSYISGSGGPGPTRGWRFAVLFFSLIAAVSGGCTDREATPTNLDEGLVARPQLAVSRGGNMADLETMKENLKPITRAVALALADEDVRTQVYRALQESRVPENKLHFRSLLASIDNRLLDEASTRAGISKADYLATLDGILDLEFYMPVDEHRAVWQGGPDLLVASQIDDEPGSMPFAFDLAGDPVPIDPEIAPETPVLALVPVEIDYWAQDAKQSGLFVARDLDPDGIWMTFSEIADDFEGILMGDPEFEVHSFVRTDGEWEDVECAGEQRSSPYYFNQDNLYAYGGDVLLIADEDVQGDSVLFMVWEDDNEPCTSYGGRPPKGTSGFNFQIDSLAFPAISVGLDPPVVSRIVRWALEHIVLNTGLLTDDWVGTIAWPPVTCWPEASGGVWADIMHNSSKEGYARLDDTFGEGRTPLCDLNTTISGPDSLTWCSEWFQPDPDAIYTASVSGGSGTPSYQWWFDGDFVSDEPYVEIPNEDLSEGEHQLYVLATRGGEQAVDVKEFTVGIDCSGS